MSSKELLADLRNKLSPVMGYFDMMRLLEQMKANSNKEFIDGWNQATLDRKIKDQQIKAEQVLPQIIYIVEQLEKHAH